MSEWVYVVGFTNKKNVDIKKEFGEEYDFYDEEGEKRELIKASFFDNIFDKKEKAFESCCAPTEKIKQFNKVGGAAVCRPVRGV